MSGAHTDGLVTERISKELTSELRPKEGGDSKGGGALQVEGLPGQKELSGIQGATRRGSVREGAGLAGAKPAQACMLF